MRISSQLLEEMISIHMGLLQQEQQISYDFTS